MNNKIGTFIETRRKEKKLTQKQLAKLLGVSNTAISKWEHGNNLPDISMLEPLSQVLEIEVLDLIKAQSITHEQLSKKSRKIRKNKYINYCIILLIVISIMCVTNIHTYQRINKLRQEDLNNQTEVYRIKSLDGDFLIDGYLILNNHQYTTIINEVKYQLGNTKLNKLKDLDKLKMKIHLSDKTIYYSQRNVSGDKIEKEIMWLANSKEEKNIDISDKVYNTNDFFVTFELYEEDEKTIEISQGLTLEKEFI